MSSIELLNAKIKSIWDFGRVAFAFSMAGAGLCLIDVFIISPLDGITDKTPYVLKVITFLPSIPLAYYLGLTLYKLFLSFRAKCKNESDFWMIMLSFSLAGMFIMPVRMLIFHLVGINAQTPFWIKVLVYIPIIPPAYYTGLMVFGTLLGQREFFWGFIAKRFAFLSSRKNIQH